MSKPRGRPKKAVRQEKNIGFFVTIPQYAVIERKAAQAGVNLSDYMRQAAVHAVVKAVWSEEERQMVKQLISISVDIHRLVEVAREQGAIKTAVVFLKSRDTMDEIIKKLCHER